MPNPILVMKLKTDTATVFQPQGFRYCVNKKQSWQTARENNGIFCFWKNSIVETKPKDKISSPIMNKSPNYSQCICFLTLVPHALQLDIMSHGMS